jgi:hypothetical protein
MNRIRTALGFILNSAFAVVGPEIIGWPLLQQIPSSSPSEVIAKACVGNPLIAAVLGVLVQKLTQSKVVRWAWPLPLLSLAIGLLVRYLSGGAALTARFTGLACTDPIHTWDQCRDFFVFTLPILRAVPYSLAALATKPGGWTKTADVTQCPPGRKS